MGKPPRLVDVGPPSWRTRFVRWSNRAPRAKRGSVSFFLFIAVGSSDNRWRLAPHCEPCDVGIAADRAGAASEKCELSPALDQLDLPHRATASAPDAGQQFGLPRAPALPPAQSSDR